MQGQDRSRRNLALKRVRYRDAGRKQRYEVDGVGENENVLCKLSRKSDKGLCPIIS